MSLLIFLYEIIFNLKKKIIAISGNHDSGKRLEISKSFFEKNSYYIYGNSYDEKISFDDEFGKVNFYPYNLYFLIKLYKGQ